MVRLTKEREQELVPLVLGGDKEAFTEIYKALHPMVRGRLRKMGLPVDDTEDVTHDIFMKAMTRLHQFNGQSRLSTWVHRITVNHMLERQRSTRNKVERCMLSTDTVYEPTVGWMDGVSLEGTPCKFEDNPDIELMYAKISKLPVRMRNVLYARLEGYKSQEIAEQQGRHLSAVKSDIHRAVKLLRMSMGVDAWIA